MAALTDEFTPGVEAVRGQEGAIDHLIQVAKKTPNSNAEQLSTPLVPVLCSGRFGYFLTSLHDGNLMLCSFHLL